MLSTSEVVAERLIEMIHSGVFKPGDLLPSEDELCETFGVGRSSIREAKRILITKKLIKSGSGKGTYVHEMTVDDAVSSAVVHRLLAQDTKDALQEARQTIEVRSVELAVARADDQDLAEMSRILEAMRKEAEQGRLAYKIGMDFHLALVNATHNPVFGKLYEIIAELLRVHQEEGYSHKAQPEIEYEEHLALFEAIKNRDLLLAVELMRAHLDYVGNLEDHPLP
jgi:GntR family transcriptional repressor for pyruvate dehydrogenase complex